MPRFTPAGWPALPCGAGILVCAGAFHVYRGEPAEGVVFIGSGILLVGTEAMSRRRPEHPPGRPAAALRLRPQWSLLAIAVMIAATVTLGVLPLYSVGSTILVGVGGLATVILGWAAPARRHRSEKPVGVSRTALAWIVVGLALAVAELLLYFLGTARSLQADYPALSDLIEPTETDTAGRLIFAALWMLTGWLLLTWTLSGSTIAKPRRRPGIDADGRPGPVAVEPPVTAVRSPADRRPASGKGVCG